MDYEIIKGRQLRNAIHERLAEEVIDDMIERDSHSDRRVPRYEPTDEVVDPITIDEGGKSVTRGFSPPAEKCSDGTKLGQQVVPQGPLPDSGRRREFATGSVRDDRTGKGRYDLLSPIALMRDAILMENGAIKYDARNWEKGQPVMSFYDSAIRHLYKWVLDMLEGKKHEEDHLAAARWNIAAMMHVIHMVKLGNLPPELDDRPGVQGNYKVEVDDEEEFLVEKVCHSEPGQV